MKTITLVILFMLVTGAIIKSQTLENKKKIYDLNVNYIYSIKGVMDTRGVTDGNKQIPYGIGISGSFKFNKRIFAELGIAFKTTKENIKEYYQISEYGYSGYVIHKYKRSFLDFPLQLNFNVINSNTLKLFIFTGIKGTVFYYYDNYNYIDSNNLTDNNEINFAEYMGLKEYLILNNKISLFSAQSLGYYIFNEYNNYRFQGCQNATKIIDIKIGFVYKLNKN